MITPAIPFEDVFEQASEDHDHIWDHLTDTQSMHFAAGKLHTTIDGAAQSLALTPWSESQLCTRLGIPVSYFRRCSAALQEAQVTHWMKELQSDDQSSLWKLRGKGEVVRAIVSPRYAPFDNIELLRLLSPYVDGRFTITLCTLTDESFHLRLIDLTKPREVEPGDGIVAGLHIANSEVGKRSLTIDACVYRLVCTNGLVRLVKGRSLLHQRHVGIPQRNLPEKVGDVILNAMEESERSVLRMMESASIPIADMDGAIDRLAQEHDFSKTLRESVANSLLSMRPHLQETRYGLVNALTDAAKALAPDDRYSLEAVAGKLLGTRESLVAA